MPADQEFSLTIGRDGLNLRDQAAEVPVNELVDSLNWRIDENGAVVKRNGFTGYGELPARPLSQTTYSPIAGTSELIFTCANGYTYSSPGDGSFTAIAGPLAAAKARYTVLDNVLYWVNGIDTLQSWDGSTWKSLNAQDEIQTWTATGAPTRGSFEATWNGETTPSSDDIQTLTITGNPSGGTFKLVFAAQTTATITFDATSGAVQSALVGLSTIAGPYVNCSGGPLPNNPITIEFTGIMGSQPQTAITTTASTLSGGSSPAVSVAHTQTGSGLAATSTASQVQAILGSLLTIGSGNIIVTGGPLTVAPLQVQFSGSRGDSPQSLFTIVDNFDAGGVIVTETQQGSNQPPAGQYITTWRNRLWIGGSAAQPNTVWWSAINEPTEWQPTNFVSLASAVADRITGLAAAPNIGSGFDGLDGILVYKQRSLHRIIDDSDNILGVETGGANVLVDTATGTLSHESIVHQNGRVYCLAENGIYSTDGHASQRLESSRLGRFFQQAVPESALTGAVGCAYDGSILYAIQSIGADGGTRVLEVSTSLAASDRSHPIMVHDLPISLASILPIVGAPHAVIFCDSSPDDERLVRFYPIGGADADGATSTQPITAFLRSGATTFSAPGPKRFRRLQVTGRGALTIGVEGDLESGIGEPQTIDLTSVTNTWGGGSKWGDGSTWSDGAAIESDSAWYTRRARRFGFYIQHIGSTAASRPGSLGTLAVPTGGAAVFDMTARITPLEGE